MTDGQFDFELLSLLRALGILQGLALGIILIISSRKNKSTLFLGLFILGFTFEFLEELLTELRFLNYNPRQLLFLLNLSWIIFPLFFIYVQKISIIPRDKISYWVIYPGIIAVVVHILLRISGNLPDYLLEETYTYEILYGLSLVYSLYIVYRINGLIWEHKKEVKKQYAEPDQRLLEWTRFFAFFCFTLVTTRVAALFMDKSETLDLAMAGLNIVLIALIAISGFFQYNVFNVLSKPEVEATGNTGSQVETDQITESRSREMLERMDKLLLDSDLYKKQDLTIADVGVAINEHPRAISNALNTYYKKNFNTYINEFRIQKARELLQGGYSGKMSIEGLANEVGFRSKTSFYRAFKENTEMTPVEYVRQLETEA